MSQLPSTFPDLLKYLRKQAGLTQDEMGRAVGYSGAQVARLEAGSRKPDVSTVAALFLSALHLRVDSPAASQLVALAGQGSLAKNADPMRLLVKLLKAGNYAETAELLIEHVDWLLGAGEAPAAAECAQQVLHNAPRAALTPALRSQLNAACGDLLVNTVQTDVAENAYRTAIELCDEARVRTHLTLKLINCLLNRSQAKDAMLLLNTLAPHIDGADALLASQHAASEATAHYMLTQVDQAAACAERALQLSEPALLLAPRQAEGARAMAYNVLAAVNRYRQNAQIALNYYGRAAESAKRAGKLQMEARALYGAATILYDIGQTEAAIQRCQAALAQARATHDDSLVSRALNTLGVIYQAAMRLDEALEMFQASHRIKQERGDRSGMLMTANGIGNTLLWMGRAPEACRLLTRALLENDDVGEKLFRAVSMDTLALAHLVCGEFAIADAMLVALSANPIMAEHSWLKMQVAVHQALLLLSTRSDQLAWPLLAAVAELPTNAEACIELLLVQALCAWLEQHDLAAMRQLCDQAAQRAEAAGYQCLLQAAHRVRNMPENAPPATLIYPLSLTTDQPC